MMSTHPLFCSEIKGAIAVMAGLVNPVDKRRSCPIIPGSIFAMAGSAVFVKQRLTRKLLIVKIWDLHFSQW